MAAFLQTITFLVYITHVTSFVNCRYNATDMQNIWNCSNSFIMDIPQQNTIPSGVTTYDLSFNNIRDVVRINSSCKTVATCKGCLQHLYLQNNEIVSIANDAFTHLVCLHTLDLSYNKIKGTSLGSMTFIGLVQLKTLILKGNPLMVFKDFSLMFTELSMLANLDVSSCQISKVEQLAFSDIDSLETIDLSNNNLIGVDPLSFHNIHLLETLDLRRNKLQTIQKRNFEHLIKLKNIYLDHNKIDVLPVDAFEGLENVEILSLSNNSLKGIPYHAIVELTSLLVLNMSMNPVHNVKSTYWTKGIVSNIREMYIDHMDGLSHIEHKAFEALPYLMKVTITGNPLLKEIPEDIFIGNIHQIKEVYLHDNALVSLPENLLPWKNLDVLNVYDNDWMCDCTMTWIVEMKDIFLAKNFTIRCSGPDSLRGANLLETSPGDLRCYHSLLWILVTFVAASTLVIIVVVSVVVWKYRHTLWCLHWKGRYVSVYTKDDQGEDDTVTIVNVAEDEIPLKEAQV